MPRPNASLEGHCTLSVGTTAKVCAAHGRNPAAVGRPRSSSAVAGSCRQSVRVRPGICSGPHHGSVSQSARKALAAE